MASGSAMGVIFLDKSEHYLSFQLQCERAKRGLLSNQRQLTKIGYFTFPRLSQASKGCISDHDLKLPKSNLPETLGSQAGNMQCHIMDHR